MGMDEPEVLCCSLHHALWERDEMTRRKLRVERDLGAQLAEVREKLAFATVELRKLREAKR